MSHYSLILVGEEEQMFPFSMIGCGIDGEHVREQDVFAYRLSEWHENGCSEDFRTWLEETYGTPFIGPNEEPDVRGEHKFGYARLDENGAIVGVIERDTPNGKWDGFQLGGRWSDFFLLYSGERTHTAMLKDIDFSGMTRECVEKALLRRSEVQEVLRRHPPLKFWEDVPRESKNDTKAARIAYHEQSAIRELEEKELDYDPEFYIRDDLLVFIKKMTVWGTFPYAFLLNGRWYERGKCTGSGSRMRRFPRKSGTNFARTNCFSSPRKLFSGSMTAIAENFS